MAAVVQLEKTAARSAPLSETTVLGWLRKNLFSSWTNTALTIISIYIIYAAVKGFYVWGVADAVWVAKDRRECFDISIDGACWAGVIQWMNNFIYGRYPRGELWRVNLGGLMLVLWMAPLWLPRVRGKIFIGLSTVFLYPFLAGYFCHGTPWRQVTSQDPQVAGFFDGIIQCVNNILTFAQARNIGQIFRNGLAGDRETITINKIVL